MNMNLILRNGRNFKHKLWQKQSKFKTPLIALCHVQIPPRIERGPTDILKALSATIKMEPISSEYKFQYGGIFSLNSTYKKRSISLCFESGRKAAKWVVSENPKLFQHRSSEPYIEAFSPPRQLDEDNITSEENLIDMIEHVEVELAIKVYEILQGKGIDVSNSTKQHLLELVCFYNCTNKPDENLIESNYFSMEQMNVTNTWKSEGFAMKLFSEMEKNCESYSALILGMFKYCNTADAMDLCEKAEEEGIKFDVSVYNSMLERMSFQSYQYETVENNMLEILRKMAKENIKPNLETLNCSLKSVIEIRKWHRSREFAWSLFSEFKNLGIKPSLSTYYYLLKIFFDRSKIHDIFYYILSNLEKEELVLQDVDDFKFFPTAMEKCAYNFNDIELAYKIDKILNTGNNRDFLNFHFSEHVYYRSYLTVLFEKEELQTALKVYCDLVPSTYTPDIGTYVVILNCIKSRKGNRYLPRLWLDLKNMRLSDSEKILDLVILIIEKGGSEATAVDDNEITTEAWKNIQEGNMKIGWNSKVVSAFLKIFSRCNNKEMAYEVFDFAQTLKSSSIALNFDSLRMFLKLCVSVKDKEKALKCIENAAETQTSGIENLLRELTSGFEFEEKDLNRLKKYVKEAETEI